MDFVIYVCCMGTLPISITQLIIILNSIAIFIEAIILFIYLYLLGFDTRCHTYFPIIYINITDTVAYLQ